MSKEAGFLETIVTDTKSVNVSVGTSNKEEVKTTPSLFDTMLSNANSANLAEESESSPEKVPSSEINKALKANTNNITPTSVAKEPLLADMQSDVNSQIASTKNSSSVISLLDKLVQEASAQINNENISNRVENNTLQTPVSTSLNETEVKTPIVSAQTQTEVTTKQANVSTQEVSKELIQAPKSVPETASTSLLDRLLQEVNVQIQSTNSNALIEEVSQKDETLVPQETNPSKSTPLSLTPENNVSTQTTLQETVNSEIKVPNNENSSSLLDKLIKEANVLIQNESVTSANSNEVEVVTTTQIKDATTKEVLQVQEQKVVVEVNNLKSQDSLLSDDGMSKNSKETATLAQTKAHIDTSLINNSSDKVAQELAKVTPTLNETTSLTKEQLLNAKPEVENNNEKPENKSLLDKLLDETKATIKATQENVELKTSASATTAAKMPTEPILTNIYLSSLNKASQEAYLETNHEVKTLVANATSVKDVQKGADLLNLGLQSSEVVLEEEAFKQNVKNEFLSKLSINRDIVKHDITKMSEEIVAQSKMLKNEATMVSTTNLLASANLPEIEVNVSAANAYTIENRIIGARQQMGSMMSDLARNMYLNYKPPVTAFRMNLNPGNLGSIAVLIRNDKENGLNISLNMSNVATLDSIVDNQGALRAALAKNFNTNTNINLEFNMQEGKQEGQNSGQHNKKQQQNHQATNDILESLSNQNDSNKVTNYM